MARSQSTSDTTTARQSRADSAMPFALSMHLRRWLWVAVPAVYIVFFSCLSLRQHATFHTYALDMGQFDQAIWNTAQGRFMANTIKPPNTMGWHFTPGFVLLAALYRILPDVRLLLVLQTVAFALTGVPFYLYARRHLGTVPALVVLCAFYLMPSLHRVNLEEFRRLSLAAPGIALAWYGLMTKRTRLLVVALAWVLLFEEDLAFIVGSFGLYLLVARPKERWVGSALLVGSALWLGLALLVFMPHFGGQQSAVGSQYPQLDYFGYLKDKTTLEAVGVVLSRPWILLQPLLSADRLLAVLRELAPMGLLPLLAPGVAALTVPSLLLMMASTNPQLYLLQKWYMAAPLPILFGATVAALTRLQGAWRTRGVIWLGLASIVGAMLLSPAPGGRAYDPARFRLEPRHQAGHRMLAEIPPQAALSAQTGLVPHLSHRESIWDYPIGAELAEYIALDLHGNTYPLQHTEYLEQVKQLLADPTWDLQQDCSGYMLLRRRTSEERLWPPLTDGATGVWEGAIELLGATIAVDTGKGHCFGAIDSLSLPDAGSTLRVTLYWHLRQPLKRDYTVFTHLVDDSGAMLGQHDGPPTDTGLWPDEWAPLDLQRTSTWHTGRIVRDIHYLSMDHTTQRMRLLVGWYDGQTGERLTLATGEDQVVLHIDEDASKEPIEATPQ